MGINQNDYYEPDHYMSVSKWKKLNKCELDGFRGFDNSNLSTALLVGQFVDSYVEGTLDEFKKNHPEIISSKGKTKGQLKADYKYAEVICDYIDNDPMLQKFLSGDKQTIMTGEIQGVPFKIKMDSYSEGIAINDLKVMRTVTNSSNEFYDFITPWGYDVQLACYQEIVRQNTGDKLPCYICAVTKEDPINSVIIKIPQDVMDKALYRVEENIKHLYDVLIGKVEPQGCGKCKTCISERKSTPIISMTKFLEGNYE